MNHYKITNTKTGISEVIPASRLRGFLIIYGLTKEGCEIKPIKFRGGKTRGRLQKCLKRLVSGLNKGFSALRRRRLAALETDITKSLDKFTQNVNFMRNERRD